MNTTDGTAALSITGVGDLAGALDNTITLVFATLISTVVLHIYLHTKASVTAGGLPAKQQVSAAQTRSMSFQQPEPWFADGDVIHQSRRQTVLGSPVLAQ